LNKKVGEVVAAAEKRPPAPQHNLFSTNAKRADDILNAQ